MTATNHPNVERVRRYLEAWSQEDPEVVLEQCADDVVVHVGGRHQRSASHQGRAAVSQLHAVVRQQTGLQIQQLEETLADDGHAVGIFSFNAHGAGNSLQATCAVAMKLDNQGKVAGAWYLIDDQSTGDSSVQRQRD